MTPVFAEESKEEKTQTLQSQIDALEREVLEVDGKLQETKQQTLTLNREVNIFNAEIQKRQLELRRIDLAVRQAALDIGNKSAAIDQAVQDMDMHRRVLAKNLRTLYAYDQENLLAVIAKNAALSDFFLAVHSLRLLQTDIGDLVKELKETKTNLETERVNLEEFKEAQQSLRSLREIERRGIEAKRAEKDRLLKETRGKESIFQSILKAKKENLAELKTQLFYLGRTGVAAEDALHFAKLAAERTGIRPAFLLALLEIETGKQFEDGMITAGTYLGNGNWRDDMYACYIRLGKRSAAESQKNAFFAITEKLNFNPDQMPVSRRPSYGCGGAMGPAQFIPTTWLLFEKRVAELTIHNPPNPWNIEDAFTAAAIFLADSGAALQTRDGELRAARTYISGRPSCPSSGQARSACLWYGNRVIALAGDIDRSI